MVRRAIRSRSNTSGFLGRCAFCFLRLVRSVRNVSFRSAFVLAPTVRLQYQMCTYGLPVSLDHYLLEIARDDGGP